ncbi:hypothetical protein [Tenacibaculum sp. 190524A05c]|uniref:BZIP transcription factor n=1 Tax=Tenacibaculum platacis TaxID=3137852 RepID=A0ABP1ET64_9FLAO
MKTKIAMIALLGLSITVKAQQVYETPVKVRSTSDAIISFQTLDDTWLYSQWLNSSNVRKAYMGFNSGLSTFILGLENGASKFAIPNGNVGIGTTGPTQKLQISGTDLDRVLLSNQEVNYSKSSPKLSFFGFTYGSQITGPSLQKINTASYGRGRLAFFQHGGEDYTSETEVMSIDYNGNVGIGATSPKSKLDLGGNYSNPSTYPNKITLWSGGANNYFGFGVSEADLDYFSQFNHRFYTGYNGSPGVERMVIASNGNVGIGTTAPSEKLEVNGNIYLKGTLSFEGNLGNRLGTGSTLTLYDNDVNRRNRIILGADENGSYLKSTYGNGGTDAISFRDSGNNQVLKISESGNIGIGTPTPSSKLEVVGNIKAQNLTLSSTASFYSSETGKTSRRMTINTIDGDNMYLYNFDESATTFHTMNFGGSHNLNSGVTVLGNGNVGIGTGDTKGFNLAVAGSTGIVAEKVTVKLQSAWPDYVFTNNYQLPTLEEVEQQIKEKGHLANIPSAKEVKENGVELGEMNKKLLEKVEELTLYTIQQNKEIKMLKEENKQLKSLEERLAKLEALLNKK